MSRDVEAEELFFPDEFVGLAGGGSGGKCEVGDGGRVREAAKKRILIVRRRSLL